MTSPADCRGDEHLAFHLISVHGDADAVAGHLARNIRQHETDHRGPYFPHDPDCLDWFADLAEDVLEHAEEIRGPG